MLSSQWNFGQNFKIASYFSASNSRFDLLENTSCFKASSLKSLSKISLLLSCELISPSSLQIAKRPLLIPFESKQFNTFLTPFSAHSRVLYGQFVSGLLFSKGIYGTRPFIGVTLKRMLFSCFNFFFHINKLQGFF